MNNDEEKWRVMLGSIKAKGRRKQKVRTFIKTASFVIVLALGTFSLKHYYSQGHEKPLFASAEIAETEMMIAMDYGSYYDLDFGMIDFDD